MAAVVRLGDMCTGHSTFPPRPSTSGSPNVFINGIPAHRVGDSWAAHCAPRKGCHGSSQATGSPSVFINNIALARVGDQIACGSFNAAGSPDVFSGDRNSVLPGFSGASFATQFADVSDIEPTY